MPKHRKKDDLRVLKTRRALFAALYALLSRYGFSKITVYDICAESVVSKTAFYAHFRDKYDLLEQWLAEQRRGIEKSLVGDGERKTRPEDVITDALRVYAPVLRNLLEGGDREQQLILIRSLRPELGEAETDAVKADFAAGGIYYLLYCHGAKTGADAGIIGQACEMVGTLLGNTMNNEH